MKKSFLKQPRSYEKRKNLGLNTNLKEQKVYDLGFPNERSLLWDSNSEWSYIVKSQEHLKPIVVSTELVKVVNLRLKSIRKTSEIILVNLVENKARYIADDLRIKQLQVTRLDRVLKEMIDLSMVCLNTESFEMQDYVQTTVCSRIHSSLSPNHVWTMPKILEVDQKNNELIVHALCSSYIFTFSLLKSPIFSNPLLRLLKKANSKLSANIGECGLLTLTASRQAVLLLESDKVIYDQSIPIVGVWIRVHDKLAYFNEKDNLSYLLEKCEVSHICTRYLRNELIPNKVFCKKAQAKDAFMLVLLHKEKPGLSELYTPKIFEVQFKDNENGSDGFFFKTVKKEIPVSEDFVTLTFCDEVIVSQLEVSLEQSPKPEKTRQSHKFKPVQNTPKNSCNNAVQTIGRVVTEVELAKYKALMKHFLKNKKYLENKLHILQTKKLTNKATNTESHCNHDGQETARTVATDEACSMLYLRGLEDQDEETTIMQNGVIEGDKNNRGIIFNETTKPVAVNGARKSKATVASSASVQSEKYEIIKVSPELKVLSAEEFLGASQSPEKSTDEAKVPLPSTIEESFRLKPVSMSKVEEISDFEPTNTDFEVVNAHESVDSEGVGLMEINKIMVQNLSSISGNYEEVDDDEEIRLIEAKYLS